MSDTPLIIFFEAPLQLVMHVVLKRCLPFLHEVQLFSTPKQSLHKAEQFLHSLLTGSPNWPSRQCKTQFLDWPVLFKNLPSSQLVQYSGESTHSLQSVLHWPHVPSVLLT